VNKSLSESSTILTIINVVKQKNKKNYEIIFDNDQTISLHEDMIVKYHLHKDKKLDPSELSEIIKSTKNYNLYLIALNYLSKRPYSIKELRNKLKSKALDTQDIAEVIEKLNHVNYLDDEQYAKLWIEQHSQHGIHRIRFDLKQKGIEESIIKQALSQITHEDMIQAALNISKKKWQQIQGTNHQKKMKLFYFLSRKGYDMQTIQHIFDLMPINDKTLNNYELFHQDQVFDE
jgi:regulatory protein